MPLPVAEVHPYRLLNRYPGMGKRDEIIWDKFVQQRPGAFDSVFYNVALGDPARDDIERGEMEFNGGLGVSCWRVDVVGVKDGRQYVIEVKPNAGADAVGQALCNKAILVSEGKVKPDAIPLVITDNASMILLQAAALLGCGVQQV